MVEKEEEVGAGRWVGGRRVVAVVHLVVVRVLVVRLPWVMNLQSEGENIWAVWWWSVGVCLEQEGERTLVSLCQEGAGVEVSCGREVSWQQVEACVEVFSTVAGVRVVKVHL